MVVEKKFFYILRDKIGLHIDETRGGLRERGRLKLRVPRAGRPFYFLKNHLQDENIFYPKSFSSRPPDLNQLLDETITN